MITKAKIKHLERHLVDGCTIGHKPHLLHVSGWDKDQIVFVILTLSQKKKKKASRGALLPFPREKTGAVNNLRKPNAL